MHRNIASRCALSTLFAVAACARLSAQTPAAPTITFNQAGGATVHQSAGVVQVKMTASDPVGLSSASLSGGFSSAIGNYPYPPTTASLTVYFYVSYLPVGDYAFKATATDTVGRQTATSIILHLVP